MPYTTIKNMLNRGIKNSSAVNVVELCKSLGIEFEALYEGIIVEKKHTPCDFRITTREQAHIEKYRTLDTHGIEVVNSVLDMECKRIEQLEIERIKKEREEKERKKATQTKLEDEDEEEPARQLPLYEYSASAGAGVFAGNGEYELVNVPDDVPYNANFGVKIKGNSMEPEIPNGSIAWVRQQPDVDYGDICIVVIEEEGYCKVKTEEGFESVNPDYGIIKPSRYDNIRISGKVVYVQKPDEIMY